MAPKVSVIMSVYEGERYLRQSVESILNQSFTDIEFLIIEDGSGDDTWDILTEYASQDQRVVLVRNQENIGLTKSLNRGLAQATGKYVARQDADDVSFPGRLATQIEFLQKHDQVGLLGTAYHLVDEQGQTIETMHPPETDTEIRWQMLFHNAFCHTSVMFKRALLKEKSLSYDETLTSSQDYELWVRMLQQTSGANLQTPLVAWRRGEKAISNTRRDEQQEIATQIAARQINSLFAQKHFSLREVEKLRHYYCELPQRPEEEWAQIYRHHIQILGTFMKQPKVDPAVVCQILRKWVGRILSTLIATKRREAPMFGSLAFALRMYVSAILMHLARREKLSAKQPHVQVRQG